MSRRDVSFRNERSDADRSSDMDQQSGVAMKVLDAMTSSRSKRSLRFKRATVYTCEELRAIDNSVTSLSAEDLAAMDNTEFQNCMDFFGSMSDWSTEQLSALATQTKTAFGSDVSTWTSDTILEASSIVAGLSSDEIGTLALDSIDVLASIGEHDLYDSAQLMAGFEQFLSVSMSDSAVNLDTDALMSGGHFVCGASSNSIGDIDPANYRDAASYIGALGSCEEAQLQAFATLAKDTNAFGSDISSWDTATIAALGSVIGGLSSSEFGSLNEEQISTINTAHISMIPGSVLSGLSTEQIGYLSTTQGGAITSEQLQSFSDDQLDALEDVGVDVNENSAAGVTFSLMLMAMTLIVTWL